MKIGINGNLKPKLRKKFGIRVLTSIKPLKLLIYIFKKIKLQILETLPKFNSFLFRMY
jgi:hypothetical protein